MIRYILLILILKGMFYGRPEVHSHGTDLYLYLQCLRSIHGLHLIIYNHVITAVPTGLLVGNVILFLTNCHICAKTDNRYYFFNIFHKLANDPDACHVIQFLLHLFQLQILLFQFIQNTGY